MKLLNSLIPLEMKIEWKKIGIWIIKAEVYLKNKRRRDYWRGISAQLAIYICPTQRQPNAKKKKYKSPYKIVHSKSLQHFPNNVLQ
jgi:hypothetical protein